MQSTKSDKKRLPFNEIIRFKIKEINAKQRTNIVYYSLNISSSTEEFESILITSCC